MNGRRLRLHTYKYDRLTVQGLFPLGVRMFSGRDGVVLRIGRRCFSASWFLSDVTP